jgi:hypothetical protein
MSIDCSSGNVLSVNLAEGYNHLEKKKKKSRKRENKGRGSGYRVKRLVLPEPQSPSIITLNFNLVVCM